MSKTTVLIYLLKLHKNPMGSIDGMYEPSPGGRVGTGVEDYEDWAKKAAESCMGKLCRY